MTSHIISQFFWGSHVRGIWHPNTHSELGLWVAQNIFSVSGHFIWSLENSFILKHSKLATDLLSRNKGIINCYIIVSSPISKQYLKKVWNIFKCVERQNNSPLPGSCCLFLTPGSQSSYVVLCSGLEKKPFKKNTMYIGRQNE